MCLTEKPESEERMGWLLTKLCSTGCASLAQKRKTDFLSKVITDSASSCCFCHGSSWFQTGRPDLPSITTTSRQGRDLALTGVQEWVHRETPCSGMACAVSFHACGHTVMSVTHRNGKSEEQGMIVPFYPTSLTPTLSLPSLPSLVLPFCSHLQSVLAA